MLFNNAGEWIREDNTYTEDGFQVHFMSFTDTVIRLLLSELLLAVA